MIEKVVLYPLPSFQVQHVVLFHDQVILSHTVIVLVPRTVATAGTYHVFQEYLLLLTANY